MEKIIEQLKEQGVTTTLDINRFYTNAYFHKDGSCIHYIDTKKTLLNSSVTELMSELETCYIQSESQFQIDRKLTQMADRKKPIIKW